MSERLSTVTNPEKEKEMKEKEKKRKEKEKKRTATYGRTAAFFSAKGFDYLSEFRLSKRKRKLF